METQERDVPGHEVELDALLRKLVDPPILHALVEPFLLLGHQIDFDMADVSEPPA
jgi:hypothetical protein